MNKPPMSKLPINNKLPATKGSNQQASGLPAVAKPIKRREFDDFADEAEDLEGHYQALLKVTKDLYPHCPPVHLEKAAAVLKQHEYYLELIQKCENNTARFDPEGAYDEDGDITAAQVSLHVAQMLGAIPNANPGNPEIFANILIGEIIAIGPTVIELEAACREIIRTAKFTPLISEVLKAIKAEQRLWCARREAIHLTAKTTEKLRTRIDETTAARAAREVQWKKEREELERQQAEAAEKKKRLEAEVREARRLQAAAEDEERFARCRAEQVLEYGDRVWCDGTGFGTVIDVSDAACLWYLIQFDSGGAEVHAREDIELRLHGIDDCGEIASRRTA